MEDGPKVRVRYWIAEVREAHESWCRSGYRAGNMVGTNCSELSEQEMIPGFGEVWGDLIVHGLI